MMRMWLAVALLSSSWLLGTGYFGSSRPLAWAATLAASVLLLSGVRVRLPGTAQRVAVLLLLLPTLWLIPYPHKGMAIVLAIGFAASLTPTPVSWLRRLANGAVVAGALMSIQALALHLYRMQTARAHELPTMLGNLLSALVRLLGADACLDSATIVMRNGATTARIAATWELLLAPATVCFFAGGCLLLAVVAGRRGSWKEKLFPIFVLLLIVVVWAPLRAALLSTIVLQQQMRATLVTFPNVGETLVSTWVHVALVLVLAMITGWLLRVGRASAASALPSPSGRPATPWCAAAACIVGVAMLAFVQLWAPVGERKGGRVMFVERHSTWEPTTEPYSTKVYGEAGSYNYAAVYEYSDQYYDMSRLLASDSIDAATLEPCDVLIIKTPTSRYTQREVDAVEQFVRQGGSLLLIGDHTNVFNMCTYLNDLSRPMGFSFRNDLLFRVGDPYRQRYRPSRFCHPILQRVPAMDFAVSCSIDPGTSWGTMAINNVGLYNLPPAYHESNYHPQAEYRPYMQYGSWCQLWTTTHGKGRVAAFADSTLFSNFCVFQPGKAELFVGMLEWLNHGSRFDRPATRRAITAPLALLGFGLAASSILVLRRQRGGWWVWLACVLAGWTAGGWVVTEHHRRAMPLPAKEDAMRHVVIDRTLSTVPLFTGAFADDPEGNGYGMLEQWIPRIGNYISRRRGSEVFQGDGLVLICPRQLPSQAYRAALVDWVRGGGQLLVFDTPELEDSTANSILNLFGLASLPGAPQPAGEEQPVQIVGGGASTPLLMSCEISGGEPLATWGDATVAARADVGQGTVTVVGFSSLFNDANMGYHWLQEPDEPMQARYEVLYALLRAGLQP